MYWKSIHRVLAVTVALGLGSAIATYDPAPAFAQGKSDKASKSQKAKKPGQSCDDMDKASKAYSDCVKAQAQTTKETHKADQATKTQGGKKPKTQ